jgi:hypothetical protein
MRTIAKWVLPTIIISPAIIGVVIPLFLFIIMGAETQQIMMYLSIIYIGFCYIYGSMAIDKTFN